MNGGTTQWKQVRILSWLHWLDVSHTIGASEELSKVLNSITAKSKQVLQAFAGNNVKQSII